MNPNQVSSTHTTHWRQLLTTWAVIAACITMTQAQGARRGQQDRDRPSRQSVDRNNPTNPQTFVREQQRAIATSPTQPSRQRRNNNDRQANTNIPSNPDRRGLEFPANFPDSVRSIDGSGNNVNNATWGSANTPFLRIASTGYEDGSDTPSGSNRASARHISNICATQTEPRPNANRATDFFWQWGQFLDHDIDLTPVVDPAERFDITVPTGDVWFDPAKTGNQTISLDRSLYTIVEGVRQQVNEISAFIDASNVYGSDTERANALRTLDGTGRLRVSDGNLPPFNAEGFPNAPSADLPTLFLAGDFRANEQVGLTSMHTLFIREHNFWADAIQQGEATLTGDTIYQAARAIVAGEMQAITYREFLPVLLGNRGLRAYRGYNPNVNPGIANEFATAAYRFGHTMLSSEILRLDALGLPIENGNLSLAESFFRPSLIIEDGIDPVLRGLAAKIAQEVDTFCVNEIRNFLFGPPGSGGFDLVSLNIQRGRDHGLADFNQTRLDYGLTPVQSVQEINSDADVQQRLAEAYPSVNDIDLWVGGLAEEHVGGAIVGETFHAIIKDQFERLRAGDRFWYERYLPNDLVRLVNQQTLSRIIRRNTDIGNELPNNVFVVN